MHSELIEKLNQAKKCYDEIFEQFNRIATIYHSQGKIEEYWYWIGRASDIVEEFAKVRKDIEKLEGATNGRR